MKAFARVREQPARGPGELRSFIVATENDWTALGYADKSTAECLWYAANARPALSSHSSGIPDAPSHS